MATPFLTDLQTRARGFLSGIAQEDSLIPGAVLVSASYDETAFSDDLFDDLDIPLPPSLGRAVPRRKADFLAGRAMAQAAMACLDLPPRPVGTAPSRAPLWPEGLSGSISHARGRSACLLACDTTRHFGIDTEAIAGGRALAAILSETLTDRDRTTIRQGPLPVATIATLAFSAKEALFKALHPRVGRFFGFEAAELAAPPVLHRLTLVLTADLTPALPAGQAFELHIRCTDTHVLTWLAAPAP